MCVHFIMCGIAFWKLQVGECLTFSCQASSCWDNKCLSSFAHSGSCRLQTAGGRRSLNTKAIRTPVLVPPLWLASPRARSLLLSNIYTQLRRQMYRNFAHTLLPHLEPVRMLLCVSVFWKTGSGLFWKEKGAGGLNYCTSWVKFPSHLFIQEFQEEGGVDDGNKSFYFGSLEFLFFETRVEGEMQIRCLDCDNWKVQREAAGHGHSVLLTTSPCYWE